MSPQLKSAIDSLYMNDSTVYATMNACQRQGVNEIDMLAHIVVNLATIKRAMEAEMVRIVMNMAPSMPATKAGA